MNPWAKKAIENNKEIAQYFVDKMIIGSKIDECEVKELFRKHKIITKATKIINIRNNKIQDRTWRNGTVEYLGTYSYSLAVKNGSGKELFYISFKTAEINEVLEELK